MDKLSQKELIWLDKQLKNNTSQLFEQILDTAKEVRETKKDEYTAICPAHDDQDPSLSIKFDRETGKTLLKCFGCEHTYADFLKAWGIKQSRREVCRYNYYDEEGKLLWQRVRYEPKGFSVCHQEGEKDIWHTKGIEQGLYRLPELLQDPNGVIYIVEGEKDCDRLREAGYTVTTSGGAKTWNSNMNGYFKNRDVIIIPDRDEAGKNYAAIVAKELFNVAKSIKIVKLPFGKDLFNFCESGGNRKTFTETVSKTPVLKSVPKPTTGILQHKTLSNVTPEEIEWLWPEIIPSGMLTLIVSQEGIGKSCLASNIAAYVSRGLAWPNLPETPNPKGDVIIFNAEESTGAVLVPRLVANGADLNLIHEAQNVIDPDKKTHFFDVEKHMTKLENLVNTYPKTRLIILDPITSYVSCKENSNAEVRQALASLVDFARRKNIAILMLTHLNKKVDLGMINRAIGSRAWSAIPRIIWGLLKEEIVDGEGNKIETDRRFMLNIKTGIGPRPLGLQFHIGEKGAITWETERCNKSIDENLKGQGRTSRVEEAAGWLHEFLKSGNKASATIFEEGKQQGFARNTLYRAKSTLPIKVTKRGSGDWEWGLSEQDTQESL